jgi:transposase
VEQLDDMQSSIYDDLTREDLIAANEEKDAIIASLERRISELEDHMGLGGKSSPPISIKSSLKPKSAGDPKKRKSRPRHFARKRETPTRIVDHVANDCPDCGRHLKNGGPGRSRQVIDFVPSPVEVVEHVIHDRWCGVCQKRVRPSVDFSAYVSGRRRIGHNLAGWIAYLHIQARVPLRTIQKILKNLCSVHISVGEMCDLMKMIAQKGKPVLDQIKNEVQTSSCVHADETGWRENGQYRCLWSFSTKTCRLFHIDLHRTTEVALEWIGERFSGVLVSDFYAAYNKIPGRHQRCWPHFHRALEELMLHPLLDDTGKEWLEAVIQTWRKGRSYRAFCLTQPRFGASVFDRRRKRRELEQELTALVEPYWEANSAVVPQATLARRAGIFMNELFTFVEFPEVPDDNNAAERAIRQAVIIRKICGGTRSEQGSNVKAALMSLFATWNVRGENQIEKCRAILTTA